eukprot:TRINITY_DN10472_c0_g1_i1.p1 TRINITY_DN10472_c0_g1~~TRINITY_DN10472_c0_g1_i1.p1  ORF type:complete len:704 (+),score=140.10 TRINITY_DN10472_c0_g1_i1:97-2208(+)
MRKRDLGIVLLATFALFFAVQNEGSFSFREAWFYPRFDDTPVKHEAERLPPPLVADLNADGRSEIIVATADATLKILNPHHSRADEGFSNARLLKEVSLLPENVRVSAGRRPVAMAAGTINKWGDKKVVVVVTSAWAVICFDHNLKKIWENDLQEHFPHGAHFKEVAISVSNWTIKIGDQGLIVVGGSMEVQPQLYGNLFEEEIAAEREWEKHRVSAKAGEAIQDLRNLTVDTAGRHFSYYAFAGLTGELRWSHKSEDFHRDPTAMRDMIPQHFYKLDAASLNRHTGEKECKIFRESVLEVLPHRWDRREDTRFEMAHFRKHRRRHHKNQPGRKDLMSQKPADKHTPGKDSSNKFTDTLGKAAKLAAGAKRHKGRAYVSHMVYNHSSNVIVAHLKEGIEAIHLATGRTVCKLYLAVGGLHADVNGDGVIDHVQAVGSSGAERVVPTGMTEVLRPCWGVATSGIPVREQLFDGPICRHSAFSNLFQQGGQFGNSLGGRAFARFADAGPLEVATPVLLPRKDGNRHRKGSRGDVIFLNSRGEVSSFSVSVEGKHNDSESQEPQWQVATEASWINPPAPAGTVVLQTVPTLEALPLRTRGPPEAILVAGESAAVVLSPRGSKVTVINLPEPPTAPLVYADFSGDGLTDLILYGSDGIYGFVQTRQPGAVLFSSLLGFLVIVIGVIFITQHFGESKGKPRAVDKNRI